MKLTTVNNILLYDASSSKRSAGHTKKIIKRKKVKVTKKSGKKSDWDSNNMISDDKKDNGAQSW